MFTFWVGDALEVSVSAVSQCSSPARLLARESVRSWGRDWKRRRSPYSSLFTSGMHEQSHSPPLSHMSTDAVVVVVAGPVVVEFGGAVVVVARGQEVDDDDLVLLRWVVVRRHLVKTTTPFEVSLW